MAPGRACDVELALLVMDDRHVYRGRQGADVAMVLRGVRQRSGSWRRSGTSCSSLLETLHNTRRTLAARAEAEAR